MSKATFFQDFKLFLQNNLMFNNSQKRILQKIYILGDFNIDFNKDGKMLKLFEDSLGLQPTFLDSPTHDKGSQLDWCFTNMPSLIIHDPREARYVASGCYESWFSDHKPIWLQLAK